MAKSKVTTTNGCGKRKTATYSSWAAMLSRCTNPNVLCHKHYGSRGITVCDRWRSYDAFLEDMGERPPNTTLDRIDNSKSYCKDNCRWVSQKQQVRNRRNTITLTHNGQTKSLAAWCEELGIAYSCAKERMNKGWPSNQILSTEHFKTGPRISPFRGKPRPNILRDPITKRFCGAQHGS